MYIMKKVLFLAISFLILLGNVKAYSVDVVERYEVERVELRAGEFMFKNSYFANISCDSRGPLEAYNVSSGCIFINNGRGNLELKGNERSEEHILHREYDPETNELIHMVRERIITQYYLHLTSGGPGNPSGSISLGELALQMNRYSRSGGKVFDELYDIYNTEPAFVSAVDGNSLLIVLGRRSNPSVYHFNHNRTDNVLNFSYAGNSSDPNIKSLSIVVSNMFNFLVEAQENGDKAIDIIENPDKAKYVDPSAIEDGVSYITITETLEPDRTEMSFGMLLKDDMATKIVDSYELNAPRAPETDEEEEEPETPEEPVVPEDPTQPTQPTEPGKQPNTGSYLSLIAVLWLAMFGMVFLSCRKTMFKKI